MSEAWKSGDTAVTTNGHEVVKLLWREMLPHAIGWNWVVTLAEPRPGYPEDDVQFEVYESNLKQVGVTEYIVNIVKPDALNPHRAIVPCPLWMHRFCFQMTSTIRRPVLLCEACGWTYAEVLEDVEKGGRCTVGECQNDRAAGTAVCTAHGAVAGAKA